MGSLSVLALALLAASGGGPQAGPQVSPTAGSPDSARTLLLENGRFWTGDPSRPWADEVAILGDRILAVGPGARQAAGAGARRLDLGGRLAVPGFIDSHTHFRTGSLTLSQVQLRDAPTPDVFVRRIREYAATLPAGAWVLGGNWDHENWGGELPSRGWIDSVSAGHPVFVNRLDGHMGLANSEALRRAGIGRDTPDPQGGVIVRDEHGEPTGILKDEAQGAIWARVPEPPEEQLLAALERGMAYAASEGVTSVQDMCSAGSSSISLASAAALAPSHPDLALYRRLEREGKLTVRVYCRHPIDRVPELAALGVTAGLGDPWIKLGSIKMYVDGSLGSATAAFFEPYTDAPSNRGLEIQDAASLFRALAAADRARLQLSVHAIGDRAISDLLDVFERIRETNPPWDRRWRIEHAQHIAPKDFERFRELSVIASMQPYHAIDDGRWAEKKIGAERAKTTYAFRTLLDGDVRVAFGSDWDVAPISPIQGIYAAVTRRTLDGKRPEGWVPEQKITVEEVLSAYTSEAAYAAFEEHEKGRLAPGYLADVAVIDRNLFEIPAEEIAQAKVVLTVVGGRVVHDAR